MISAFIDAYAEIAETMRRIERSEECARGSWLRKAGTGSRSIRERKRGERE